VPRLVAADVHPQSILEVGLLLRERLGLVGNVAAFDDALSGRAGAIRPGEFRMRTRLGLVILQVPVRGHQGLPDTVQIGVAIGRARRAIPGWKLRTRRHTLLSEERGNGQREKDYDDHQAEA
jgi:hypothetical protein